MNIFRLAALIVATVFVASCSNNSSPTTPTNGSGVSIVAGSSNKTTDAYSPSPIAIARGAAVTWTNNDTTVHDSTSDNGVWSSGTLAPGASFTFTFSNTGTFTYHCTIHPGMVGTVTVQ
jgi:plastocyanin